ncbi:hypothetical protein Anas_01733 [Armadillidium nasatum]|uniref:Uncharacterized protein n=1 Tax=Armadillidium nasatum TaxID=96803 RepID=A0A5N5TPA3_9CRUS|nr:hypothetical protein Anas_01733 [Armadillidium nasatum]
MNMDTIDIHFDIHQNTKSQNDKNLENNSTKSFFVQLKNFCSSLQNQYQDITHHFEIPPGSNPRNYDRGLKAIKSEVANLKKLAEATREDLNKVQQFSYFVDSTKDLINSQKKDIQRMEKYLMRYGYVPPEEVDRNYDSTEEKKRSMEENVEFKALKSPELSEIGRKVIEGNALPILIKFNKPSIDEALIVNRENVIITPIQERNSKWYLTPSSNVSSRRKVEKWIECVEAASGSVTPVYKTVRNALLFENEEDSSSDSVKHIKSRYSLDDNVNLVKTCTLKDIATTTPESPVISRIDSSFAKRPVQSQDITPEEPILSRAKNQQNLPQDTTPEEPILLSKSINRQNISQDATPEEPLLLSKSKNLQNIFQDTTPEEPLLLSQTKYQRGREKMNAISNSAFRESVSPQLSDITLKVLNRRQMEPSKNEKRINLESHNYSKIDQTTQDMEPESPKLSDVTLKVLRKHSKAF